MGFIKVILSILNRQVIEHPTCFKKTSESVRTDKTRNIYFRFEVSNKDKVSAQKPTEPAVEKQRIGF